jgi:hypothetical protein
MATNKAAARDEALKLLRIYRLKPSVPLLEALANARDTGARIKLVNQLKKAVDAAGSRAEPVNFDDLLSSRGERDLTESAESVRCSDLLSVQLN